MFQTFLYQASINVNQTRTKKNTHLLFFMFHINNCILSIDVAKLDMRYTRIVLETAKKGPILGCHLNICKYFLWFQRKTLNHTKAKHVFIFWGCPIYVVNCRVLTEASVIDDWRSYSTKNEKVKGIL